MKKKHYLLRLIAATATAFFCADLYVITSTMFSSGPNYSKLKTNLRLSINRLKLLEKKKTELASKSRKEIADYISSGKVERAKIRVEHIIREDYLVEAMEILEMYCDLLLARFGLIQQMKALDDGLAEAISSLIWAAPRLHSDVQELQIISDQLTSKYGKPYALSCRENETGTVSEKLMHKLNVQAPPKITIEKYLIEIAKFYNVNYEPDPQVMNREEETYLIDMGTGGACGSGKGGGFYIPPSSATAAAYPSISKEDFDLASAPTAEKNISDEEEPPPYDVHLQEKINKPMDFPELPEIPADTPVHGNTPPGGNIVVNEDKKKEDEEEDIDFDDLSRRFEELKKKK